MERQSGAMENVGLNMGITPEFWRDKRVLITGHTGFKGSWLSLWLQSMGAELSGLALAPVRPLALFDEARVGLEMVSTTGDIRNYETVLSAMASVRPEIVIHMAAQALVRRSYTEPIGTYATNIMGTVHILEAARQVGTVRALVNVTTDKCYDNKEWLWGYREDDPMGGHDPYSNSKACSEMITSAYRLSYFQDSSISVASVRAGNVIGGGDWAIDRLVPDTLRAFEIGQAVAVRNPSAIRPWQHVLEPLSGYLLLAEKLYIEGHCWAEGWNFGPQDTDVRPVQWIIEHMAEMWGDGANWKLDSDPQPHEATHLKLDISKATTRLGWRPRWNLEEALGRIILWHQKWLAGADMREQCLEQIKQYNETP